MSLQVFEGFEGFSSRSSTAVTGLGSRGFSASGSGTFAFETGRFGIGQCIAYNAVTAAAGDQYTLAASATTVRFGCAIKINTTVGLAPVGTGVGIFRMYDSAGTMQIDITCDPLGVWRVRRNASTIIATSDRTIGWTRANRWHFVEFEIVFNDTTGSAQMWIDGTRVMNQTGIDTVQTANVNCQRVAPRLGTDFNGQMKWDDFWIDNAAGASWGDVTGIQLLPTGDSSVVFTPSSGANNYSRVNEAVTDTTTYVQGSTAGQKDLYDLGDLPSDIDTIHQVTLFSGATKTDATAGRATKTNIKSGATTDSSSNLVLTQTTYNRNEKVHTTDPNTGSAWTAANVNAAQVGIEVAV